jgi:hypothetical protein
VPFSERVYSGEQREGVITAYAQPGVTARRVVELAAAGELPGSDGEPLPPFEVPENTVRDLARKAHKAAERPSPLLALAARDAVDALRQRLVSLADAELKALEGQTDGKRNLERMRQAGKVLEQCSRIPGPADPRPPSRPGGRASGGASGQAGALLREHRAGPSQALAPPAPAVPEPEPERPNVSTEEDPLADLRADIERVREQQREQDPPQPEPHSGIPDSRAERRRRREPVEDVSSITLAERGRW